MADQDRRAWFHAALYALRDVDADKFVRAARIAITRADRPGAVIPEIFDALNTFVSPL